MYESFEIELCYRGENLSFPAKLMRYGYTHRISVTVSGLEVVYERDEERNYRALVSPLEMSKREVDVELLRAITQKIEDILK
jgi:hypothetical protein